MSHPLRLSAKEATSNKKCVCCDTKLTTEEREQYIDKCFSCVMEDATDNELDND